MPASFGCSCFTPQFTRCRFDKVDCERETTDKNILEHRRNKLRDPLEETVEFKLLCKVKNNPEDDGYQDTFYLDPNLLAESNFSKRSMLESCKAFHLASWAACQRAIEASEAWDSDESD